MNDRNVKTIIRPTLEALSNADPTLFEMIRYIRHVIGRKDPGEAAHNAALVYLAVFTAFKDEKLLELDWAPSLSLDIGDKEFEIVISKVLSSSTDRMEIERSSALGSTAGSLPAAADTRQHRTEEGKKPEAQQKIGSSKALALLTTLFERMERNADPANTQAPAYSAALNAVVGQVKTNTTQSKVSSWLVDEMSRLDRLLVQADKISISINCCYWSIGVSYREFCKSSHNTRGHSQHPRTLEKEAFARLCAIPSISDVLNSATARSRLRKRLHRARKFVTLVDIFGEQVLQWVPEISVSRLDVVRQEDLQMIAAGSVEQKRVLAIKARLPDPPVDEVADVAVALKNSH